MAELDPRISFRAPLRCDGIGRLDCAEDTESGVRLAVRWLPLDANGDAAVKACERLPDHPTLPRIRQTGQVGGAAFVAMDFPEGRLLSTMQGERLDVDLLLRMAAQLSDALATVHAQGVLHGELSADSVLLVPPDRAWLWDMPLVIANRLTDRRGESRLMQNLVKTAAFLAPERARGGSASAAGDVYALGAVLCAAAGAPLPAAASTLGVVNMVAGGHWIPRVPATIPGRWHDVLERMVLVNPSERPTAGDVARVFAQLPHSGTLPTVPEFPAVRLPPELMATADAMVGVRPSVHDGAMVLGRAADAPADRPSPAEAAVEAADGAAIVTQATIDAGAAEQGADEPPLLDDSAVVLVEAEPKDGNVALTDSVMVAADLVKAGARTLSHEFPRVTEKTWRRGALFALAVLLFVSLVMLLARWLAMPGSTAIAPSEPDRLTSPTAMSSALEVWPSLDQPVAVLEERPEWNEPVPSVASDAPSIATEALDEEELAPLPPVRLWISPQRKLSKLGPPSTPRGRALRAAAASPSVYQPRPMRDDDVGSEEGNEPLKRPKL